MTALPPLPRRYTAGLALALFVLALAARLPGLDTFWTTDETKWVTRSHTFLIGLLHPPFRCPSDPQGRQIETSGWGCTFQTVHPGVTTMWSGALGIMGHYLATEQEQGVALRDYLQYLPTDPPNVSLIAPVRLPTVLLTALFITAFFIVATRLIGWPVALVAAAGLALDPFHSALSRVLHHDALATTFMTLSLLLLLGYWWFSWRRGWLLLSGGLVGLACLSKSLALFLLPFAAFSGLLAFVWQGRYSRSRNWLNLLVDGLLWGAAAAAVYALLFPALWVIPSEVLSRLFFVVQDIAAAGHDHFFLGVHTRDAGWLFYPVSLLLRLSPLVSFGLAALGLLLALRQTGRLPVPRFTPTDSKNIGLWLTLAAYIVMFIIFLSLTPKKITRYALPLFPVFYLLAAVGLLWLAQLIIGRFSIFSSRPVSLTAGVVLALLVAVQGTLMAQHYPYYSTYYSPLLGGTSGAAQLVTIIGWGEGQEQLADYLNQKPKAESLRVANWGHETFAPFFVGEAADYSSTQANNFTADYLAVPLRQMQNRRIDPALQHYLATHLEPEYHITLHGVDYITLYKLPVERHVDWKDNRLAGQATLFGYRLKGDELRLFWENEGAAPTQRWWLAIQPANSTRVADTPWHACPLNPAFEPEQASSPAILESVCRLPVDKLQPGLYDLQLGLGASSTNLARPPFAEGQKALQIDAAGEIVVSR